MTRVTASASHFDDPATLFYQGQGSRQEDATFEFRRLRDALLFATLHLPKATLAGALIILDCGLQIGMEEMQGLLHHVHVA